MNTFLQCFNFKLPYKNKVCPNLDVPAKIEVMDNGLESECFSITVAEGKQSSVNNAEVMDNEFRVRIKAAACQGENKHKKVAINTIFSEAPITKEVYSPEKKEVNNKNVDGCSLDTLDPNKAKKTSDNESVISNPAEPLGQSCTNKTCDIASWDNLQNKIASWLSEQSHEAAFSGDFYSLSRVVYWLNDLETSKKLDGHKNQELVAFQHSTEKGKLPMTLSSDDRPPSKDLLHANEFIQCLDSSSTMAHISKVGLKVIPTLSNFSRLRYVNLSRNSIAHITPVSLPEGLHTLNLSHNKITTMEGLRELTHLHVLDLSYNQVTQIGQGLSKCILIKELYLAQNKISKIEGLHRLSKLTVLDLSFNKITTKDLDILVANNNSLLSLNIIGNPVQKSITNKRLSKIIHALLPKLMHLNMQPFKMKGVNCMQKMLQKLQ